MSIAAEPNSGSVSWRFESWSFSGVELARPAEPVDVDAERVLAQRVGRTGLLHGDGQDSGPALGAGEAFVLVGLLGPLHLEGISRDPHDTGHLDRDRALADRLERIVGAGVVAQ